jgi:O-antigen/teichoic acid export membrane protein
MVAASHTIPNVGRKELRSFGVTTGMIVAALFGLFFPWLLERAIPAWPWILCAVLVVWGLVAPATLRPVYRGWMRFGLFMSRITTPLILGIVFFLVVTPMAFLRSLLGKDSMARKFLDSADSYRVPSKKPSKENLTRPF